MCFGLQTDRVSKMATLKRGSSWMISVALDYLMRYSMEYYQHAFKHAKYADVFQACCLNLFAGLFIYKHNACMILVFINAKIF